MIIGILAAIAIPNFLRFQAKSKQSEAKTNLGGIFTAEESHFAEHNAYADLGVVAWAPIGTQIRYTYFDGTGTAGFVANPAYAAPAGIWVPGRANLGDAVQFFTAGATGNIDTDGTLDMWGINQDKSLTPVSDDVTA